MRKEYRRSVCGTTGGKGENAKGGVAPRSIDGRAGLAWLTRVLGAALRDTDRPSVVGDEGRHDRELIVRDRTEGVVGSSSSNRA